MKYKKNPKILKLRTDQLDFLTKAFALATAIIVFVLAIKKII